MSDAKLNLYGITCGGEDIVVNHLSKKIRLLTVQIDTESFPTRIGVASAYYSTIDEQSTDTGQDRCTPNAFGT